MGCQIHYENDSVSINTSGELLVALDILPTDADREIIEQIGAGIISIITKDDEFLTIMAKALGTRGTSKQPYLKAFGNNLIKVVTKGPTISRALAMLASREDQEFFLKSLGSAHLQKCLADLDDITGCLEWLYGEMDQLFLDLIGWDFLIHRLHTGEDIGKILKFLSGEEERVLIERMGWERITECIRTDEDLVYILSGLDSANEKSLIEKLDVDKIKQIFPTAEKLLSVRKRHLSVRDGDLLEAKYKKE